MIRRYMGKEPWPGTFELVRRRERNALIRWICVFSVLCLVAWLVGCVGHVTFEMAPTATSGTGYQIGTKNRMNATASQPRAPTSQPTTIRVPFMPLPIPVE